MRPPISTGEWPPGRLLLEVREDRKLDGRDPCKVDVLKMEKSKSGGPKAMSGKNEGSSWRRSCFGLVVVRMGGLGLLLLHVLGLYQLLWEIKARSMNDGQQSSDVILDGLSIGEYITTLLRVDARNTVAVDASVIAAVSC